MRVEYPRSDPPDELAIGGETYAVEEGVVELPGRREANTLARRLGLHPAEIRTDLCSETIDSGPRAGDPCGRELPCPHHGGAE